MINTFHKDYQEKSIATSLSIDFTLSMTKLIAKPLNVKKRKRDWPAKASIKQIREV